MARESECDDSVAADLAAAGVSSLVSRRGRCAGSFAARSPQSYFRETDMLGVWSWGKRRNSFTPRSWQNLRGERGQAGEEGVQRRAERSNGASGSGEQARRAVRMPR